MRGANAPGSGRADRTVRRQAPAQGVSVGRSSGMIPGDVPHRAGRSVRAITRRSSTVSASPDYPGAHGTHVLTPTVSSKPRPSPSSASNRPRTTTAGSLAVLACLQAEPRPPSASTGWGWGPGGSAGSVTGPGGGGDVAAAVEPGADRPAVVDDDVVGFVVVVDVGEQDKVQVGAGYSWCVPSSASPTRAAGGCPVCEC